MGSARLSDEKLRLIVDEHLKQFYTRRINNLNNLQLRTVLQRKNPYLFRAMGIESPQQLVAALLQAHISSSDESIFGDAFFEPIAKLVSRGIKSSGEGLDIDIETSNERTAVAVKSGPNWANSQQIERLKENFRKARNIVRTDRSKKPFKALLGQAYGRTISTPTPKREYYTLSGQAFWKYITGDPDFYQRLIRAMGEAPSIHRELYEPAFHEAVNRFTHQFEQDFCTSGGQIDWDKIVWFNSGENVKPSQMIATPKPTSDTTDLDLDAIIQATKKRK